MTRGRPSSYTPDLADTICTRLAEGIPLAQICRDEGMPGVTTVYSWIKGNREFSEAFACAREIGWDMIAAGARLTARGEDGFSTGDVQRDKLVVDTDLKLLAKWDPKRYGDSVQLKHADAEGEKLDTADAGAAARLAALLEAVRARSGSSDGSSEDGSAAGEASEPSS